MNLVSKFKFGDRVKNKFGMTFIVNGIVFYNDGDIGYFQNYEENNELEEDLVLYQPEKLEDIYNDKK